MKNTLLLIFLVTSTFCILDLTYFEALKINPFANVQQITNAYRVRRQALPEVAPDQRTQKKIDLVQQAYRVLSNEDLRAKYQRYGRQGMKSVTKITSIDQNTNNDYRKGKQIYIRIPVTLQQVFRGQTIKTKYTRNSVCPHCQGYGFQNPYNLKPCPKCQGKGFQFRTIQRNGFRQNAQQACSTCGGNGKQPGKKCHYCKGKKVINELQTLNIQLEKGLPNGNRVVLRNAGDEREIGAPSDLVIIFQEIKSGQWIRKDKNIEYEMEISLRESIFGFERQITHLDGRKLLISRSNKVTVPDTRHLIKNEGMPQKDGTKGDLIIKFKIIIPEFNDDQLDLWQNFFDSF